jgi:hypothetical protein
VRRYAVDDALFFRTETHNFQHIYAFLAAPLQSLRENRNNQIIPAIEGLEIDQPQPFEIPSLII